MKPQPPYNALKFLRWFCREDYIEEIEGDLCELFEIRHHQSPKQAKRRFTWDVLRSFRLRNIKLELSNSNKLGMYRNYVTVALRIFKREKAFTFINLLGLSTGIAITLLIIQYARFELSYEEMYPKSDRLVRLTVDYMDGETVQTQDCETHPPTAPTLKEQLPEIENFTRVYNISEPTVNVQVGEEHFILEKLYAADSSFFSMFDYPFTVGGEKPIFDQPHQIVLTETTAFKYFNRLNVIGETIIIPRDGKKLQFSIVGVVPDSPPNTHLKFNALFSYPTMLSSYGETEDNWDGNNTYSYILLKQKSDYAHFTQSIVDFNKRLTAEKKFHNIRVIGQQIKDIHLYSHKTFEPESNGDVNDVFILLGVALLVIVSAFVNYVNLATAKALDRAKEVGIRKVVGSSTNQLRSQFLVESLLINGMAAFIAIGLIAITRKRFIDIAGLPMDFVIFSDSFFWICLIAFIVVGILFSGAYPSFVLSSFKPISVLKGKFANSKKGIFLRKGLVIFQFSITLILLVQTFTVYQQLHFLRQKELGVNVDQTIVVRAPQEDTIRYNYTTFKKQLLAKSTIKAVASSSTVPGLSSKEMGTTSGINLTEKIEDHNYNFYITHIDKDFLSLMEITLLAGNNFDETSKNDENQLIVNEEAIRLWGLPDAGSAIGKELSFWGDKWVIRGVIKDYHQESPKSAIIPIIHHYHDGFTSMASIRFHNDDPKKQIEEIKEIYKANFPNIPFSYFFMDEEYEQQLEADQQFQSVFTVLTGFAILIACLGLFGLASFTVFKRKKEIGIRKIIGASTMNILVLLSKGFIGMVFFSILVGFPVTYLIADKWLNNFAFRINLNPWLFIIPAMVVLVLALLAMGIKTLGVSFRNPVGLLTDE